MEKDTEKKYTCFQKEFATYVKALSHPARIAILEFLAQQDSCYFGNIHEELPIAKATVSQHLNELKRVNLIQGEIEGPKVRYCINKETWKKVCLLFKQFENNINLENKNSCC